MTTKDYRTKGSLRIFFSYFKPHLRLFLLDMLCALLVAAIDLAFPLVSRQALYTWLPDRAYRVFFLAMGVVVAAYVLRSVLNYVICYWGHTFGIRVEADIRRDLFTHMQDLGFDFYDRNRTGQLIWQKILKKRKRLWTPERKKSLERLWRNRLKSRKNR